MYRHTIWSRPNLEPQDLFDLLHNGSFGSHILTGTVFQFQSILLSVCFESALSLLHYRNHSNLLYKDHDFDFKVKLK